MRIDKACDSQAKEPEGCQCARNKTGAGVVGDFLRVFLHLQWYYGLVGPLGEPPSHW